MLMLTLKSISCTILGSARTQPDASMLQVSVRNTAKEVNLRECVFKDTELQYVHGDIACVPEKNLCLAKQAEEPQRTPLYP